MLKTFWAYTAKFLLKWWNENRVLYVQLSFIKWQLSVNMWYVLVRRSYELAEWDSVELTTSWGGDEQKKWKKNNNVAFFILIHLSKRVFWNLSETGMNTKKVARRRKNKLFLLYVCRYNACDIKRNLCYSILRYVCKQTHSYYGGG